MLYDTHCHIDLAKDKDRIKIIETFKKNNPEGFLNVIWTNIESSRNLIEFAKNYDYIFVSIWIHPSDINLYINFDYAILELENLYLENKEKIIWIWECWLDYFYINKEVADSKRFSCSIEQEKENQRKFFRAQIRLAKKYNLPFIIHNRDSKNDVFEILVEEDYKNFILHCYTENLDYANKLIKFAPNCMISFSWIVTFKNAKEIQETAKNIPLNNILIETDSPYLTPTPLRWKEENEPDFTKYVLKYICELRDEDEEIIIKQIFKNSIKIFWIKK